MGYISLSLSSICVTRSLKKKQSSADDHSQLRRIYSSKKPLGVTHEKEKINYTREITKRSVNICQSQGKASTFLFTNEANTPKILPHFGGKRGNESALVQIYFFRFEVMSTM